MPTDTNPVGWSEVQVNDLVASERAISFGPFRLVPTQRLLLEDGNPVRVGSCALGILAALVERPGELVGKEELMARVWRFSGGRSLPSEVVDHIVAKADGVALYVEELTKAILGSGVLETRGDAYVLTGALAQLHIPETLQDSLMARLDRAPRLREVAQLGSVLGREFAYDMISA
jgi:hypothetical protein